MNIRDLEEIFKDKLENGHEHGYEEEIWNAVDQKLNKPKSKRGIILFLSLIGLFSGGVIAFWGGTTQVDTFAELNKNSTQILKPIDSNISNDNIGTHVLDNEGLQKNEGGEKIVSDIASARKGAVIQSKKTEKLSISDDINIDNYSVGANINVESPFYTTSNYKQVNKELKGVDALAISKTFSFAERKTSVFQTLKQSEIINLDLSTLRLESLPNGSKFFQSLIAKSTHPHHSSGIMLKLNASRNLGEMEIEHSTSSTRENTRALESFAVELSKYSPIGRSNFAWSAGLGLRSSVWLYETEYQSVEYVEDEYDRTVQFISSTGAQSLLSAPALTQTISETNIQQHRKLNQVFVPLRLSYSLPLNRSRVLFSVGSNMIFNSKVSAQGIKSDVLDVFNEDLKDIDQKATALQVELAGSVMYNYALNSFVNLGFAADYASSLNDLQIEEINTNIKSRNIGFSLVVTGNLR